jgi:hypothetical protein
VQTFLAEGPNFELGAQNLDRQRLIKQAVESYQILKVLAGLSKGWVNHPAVKMWKGSEGWLYIYTMAHIDEIERRGYKNTTRELITSLMDKYFPGWEEHKPPAWLCDDRVKITHRGRLWEKNPSAYPQYTPESKSFRKLICCQHCNYFWPTHIDDYKYENLFEETATQQHLVGVE